MVLVAGVAASAVFFVRARSGAGVPNAEIAAVDADVGNDADWRTDYDAFVANFKTERLPDEKGIGEIRWKIDGGQVKIPAETRDDTVEWVGVFEGPNRKNDNYGMLVHKGNIRVTFDLKKMPEPIELQIELDKLKLEDLKKLHQKRVRFKGILHPVSETIVIGLGGFVDARRTGPRLKPEASTAVLESGPDPAEKIIYKIYLEIAEFGPAD